MNGLLEAALQYAELGYPDPDDKVRRLFLPGKNNLAPEGQGLAFTIWGMPPALNWENEPVLMNADECMAAECTTKPGPKSEVRQNAVQWLRAALAKSPRRATGWRNCNLRTTFEKIVKRAGLKPWPKLFHALRSSRETELAQEFPIHVVTGWLGNMPTIAMRHYLLTTDADFERATGGKGGADSGAAGLRNWPQRAAAKEQEPQDFQRKRHVAICCNVPKRRGQDSNLRTSFTRSRL